MDPSGPARALSESVVAMVESERLELENQARELRLQGDFSMEACLGLLQRLRECDPRTSARFSTTAASTTTTWDKYLVYGLYVRGKQKGLTRRTEEQPELVKYVNNFIKSKVPGDFGWTSFVISYDNEVPVHKDVNNVGLNAVVGLGDYINGGLWTANPDGDEVRTDSSGRRLRGHVLPTKDQVVIFDPRVPHSVEPWAGQRITIGAHSVRSIFECREDILAALRRLRFLRPRLPARMLPESEHLMLTQDAEGLLGESRPLSEETKSFLVDQRSYEVQECEDVLADLPARPERAVDVVEVGMHYSAKVKDTLEHFHIKHRFCSTYDYDLTSTRAVKQLQEMLQKDNPAWIVMRHNFQGFDVQNQNDDRQARRLKRARRVLRATLELLTEHGRRGGQWLLLCPRKWALWREEMFRTFYLQGVKQNHVHQHIVEGALEDGDEQRPRGEQKPTYRLLTSSYQLKDILEHRHRRGSTAGVPEHLLRQGLAECVKWPLESESAFGLRDEPLLSDELTPEARKKAEKMLRVLHARSGHPSNQTLASMLRGRGVHHEVVTMALNMKCPDCLETRLPDSSPAVSLQQTDVPWKVMILDNAEFRSSGLGMKLYTLC